MPSASVLMRRQRVAEAVGDTYGHAVEICHAHSVASGDGAATLAVMDTSWLGDRRDVVVIEGPDAATYLQSQASQDLRGMAVGDERWTFFLQPTGKVDVLARVTMTGDETLRARHRCRVRARCWRHASTGSRSG